MEQILLYIVTISGFSGFMLGLYSLLLPVLQRRGISLPFSRGAGGDEDDLDYDDDDEDARHFAATSFSARRSSLLDRLPSRTNKDEPDEEDEGEPEFEDDELLGDLDLSKERAEVEAEAEDGYEDDELAELTFDAEVDPILEELALNEDEEDDEEKDDGDEEEEDGEYEDDEEGEEPEKPVVQVVSGGGGGNDMLALFEEGSDAVKEVEAWRADLPDAAIDELLAEAREISAMLNGRRPRA